MEFCSRFYVVVPLQRIMLRRFLFPAAALRNLNRARAPDANTFRNYYPLPAAEVKKGLSPRDSFGDQCKIPDDNNGHKTPH